MRKQVLGINIDDITMQEALADIERMVHDGQKHYVVTPNPEFLVYAKSDEEFRNILNNADLSVPDGIGLKLSGKITQRVPGVDLVNALCGEAAEKGFTIGFLGGSTKVAERAAECLKKRYPSLKILLATGDIQVDKEGTTISKMPEFPQLDLLFVGFGHPKQEKWIAKNITKIPIRVALGIGGAFDYISGDVTRAPKFLRSLGLEWLFRLIMQPWRIKRQLNLVKFLWLLLLG